MLHTACQLIAIAPAWRCGLSLLRADNRAILFNSLLAAVLGTALAAALEAAGRGRFLKRLFPRSCTDNRQKRRL